MAEVVTGEAVVLEVPCARFPSRMLALVIDVVIQYFLLLLCWVLAAAASGGLDAASAAALAVSSVVLIIVGYPVIWETATRGRSPGKLAVGLRVVGDDGSPERFRQALVRALSAVVEIWGLFGAPALICSLISGKGKRLGDVFAGTFVIQQRLPAPRPTIGLAVTPQLAAWAADLELSALADQTAAMAQQYLGRMAQLQPAARERLGSQIAAAVSAQVSPLPPPGTPIPAYLGAVLAERRRREQIRRTPAPYPAAAAPAGPPPPGQARPAVAREGAGREGVAGGQPTGDTDRRPRQVPPHAPAGPAAGASGFVPPA